jgi:hypothetical protein
VACAHEWNAATGCRECEGDGQSARCRRGRCPRPKERQGVSQEGCIPASGKPDQSASCTSFPDMRESGAFTLNGRSILGWLPAFTGMRNGTAAPYFRPLARANSSRSWLLSRPSLRMASVFCLLMVFTLRLVASAICVMLMPLA